MRKRRLSALLLSFAMTTAAAAEPDAGTDASKHKAGAEFQFFLDNDKWAKSDRYYTNGLKLGFGVDIDNVPGHRVARDVLDRLGAGMGCGSAFDRKAGVFIGQNMYTPRDIEIASPQPFDRPWAAWLYGGIVLQALRTCGNRDALDTVELDLGVVGPIALGEEVQNVWHRFIHVPEAKGWANQIRNEPAFLLTYLHKEKQKLGFVEVIPHVGAAAGTVMSFVRTGALVRVGRHMSGFGPDRIEPGGAMLQNVGPRKACDAWWPCEAYVFAGADARIVFWNIFLDGTVFRDSPSVDRKPFVYDLSFGLSVRFRYARFTVSRVTRSEEFTSTLRGGGKQTFHSFNIGIEY
jgi:lipid A 3-O-deacylase